MTRQLENETRRQRPTSASRSRQRKQLDLPLRRARDGSLRGGPRVGAGRKPNGEKAGVPHVVRPAHDHRHPIHITLRTRRNVAPLRDQTVLQRLVRRFRRVSDTTFRIVHFSVQTDHLHLLVEANAGAVLARKMTGLTTWIARELNALMRRSGKFWNDRYHRRDLATPREVRNALVYVLQNRRKHVFQQQGRDIGGADGFSSAAWLEDGWREDAARALAEARRLFLRALGPPPDGGHPPPVASPTTWLARVGWHRAKPGLLSIREMPRTHVVRRSAAHAEGDHRA